MAIEYDFVSAPGSKADDDAQRLVPEVVTRSTISFKQMTADISIESLNEGPFLLLTKKTAKSFAYKKKAVTLQRLLKRYP